MLHSTLKEKQTAFTVLHKILLYSYTRKVKVKGKVVPVLNQVPRYEMHPLLN